MIPPTTTSYVKQYLGDNASSSGGRGRMNNQASVKTLTLPKHFEDERLHGRGGRGVLRARASPGVCVIFTSS